MDRIMNQQMDNQLPEGWETTLLENVTIILDSMRIPINNEERKRRIEGKDDSELYPYYGATGEVGMTPAVNSVQLNLGDFSYAA